MQFDNHKYNRKLQPFANHLRKEMTKAEACLWKYVLKAGQLKGYQFRRQPPVLDYIADFMCIDLMLIIEVDGTTHHWEETMAKDRKKEADLRVAGFTIIRFTDDEVLNHIHAVFAFLEEWVEKKSLSHPPPTSKFF
jgi:very-short-patch-repair endonuclease